MRTPDTYKNYAFISYSHKDRACACELQRKLEEYRLPIFLRLRHRIRHSGVFPISRDETDIAGSDLTAGIQQELVLSQYLIVICSPNSVASKWVQEEIQFFISLGRADKIIPYIIDGTPNAPDPLQEAFPAPLRGLARELRGVNEVALGQDHAFLNLVASLLNLRADYVIRRNKRRKAETAMAVGCLLLILLLSLIPPLWYLLPHESYYRTYALHYEIPTGLYPLSAEERAGLYSSYRITTQRNRVIRMECVTSEGTLCTRPIDYGTLEYAAYEYQYDEDGNLITILEMNDTGKVINRKHLIYNLEKNQIALEYRLPQNDTQATTLSGDTSDLLLSTAISNNDRSVITRRLNTYDEEGLLTCSMFQKDYMGTPACDLNGIYGEAYSYNSHGQIVEITYLNADGTPHNCKYGYATTTYDYDGALPAKCLYFSADGNPARGKDGAYGEKIVYTSIGNPKSFTYLGSDGSTPINCDSGYATGRSNINDQGHCVSVSYFDPSGEACLNEEYDCHEYRASYDEDGRQVSASFYDEDGKPIVSATAGYHSAKVFYDSRGQITKLKFFDTHEKPMLSKSYGCYEMRHKYDEDGNVILESYHDSTGNLMLTEEGYAFVELYYTEAGRVSRYTYFDAEKNKTTGSYGFASLEQDYDAFGNVTEVRYCAANDKLVDGPNGYAVTKYTYNDGRTASWCYFDMYGEKATCTDGYHKGLYFYDDRGNVIRWAYYDAEENLTLFQNSYAVWEQDYDAEGYCLEVRCYGTDGMLTLCDDGYAIKRQRYENGRLASVSYWGTDREPIQLKDTGYHELCRDYDQWGNTIRWSYYDTDGSLALYNGRYAICEQEYDIHGNIIAASILGINGEPVLQPMPVSNRNTIADWFDAGAKDLLVSRIERIYDRTGTICGERLYGDSNELLLETVVVPVVTRADGNSKNSLPRIHSIVLRYSQWDYYQADDDSRYSEYSAAISNHFKSGDFILYGLNDDEEPEFYRANSSASFSTKYCAVDKQLVDALQAQYEAWLADNGIS